MWPGLFPAPFPGKFRAPLIWWCVLQQGIELKVARHVFYVLPHLAGVR